MYRFLLILLAVFLIASSLLLFGQTRNRAYKLMLGGLLSHTVPEIDIPAAARAEGVFFLDAREPVEYEVSHIEGALNVGFNHFDLQSVAHIPKDTPVIIYCSVGFRSEKITEKMKRDGFTAVSNLYGGIFEWVNEGHAVVCNGVPTERVHAFDRVWGIWLHRGTRVY
jgi:rhodanese-related sulfurtransferase